ncbi:sensor histidine kinase [Paenibacillus protaetiae]|uniref:histidine kinase n=1 Tax=Paenibacillus protaetiae TaxID=2509456 RepID=A0A4P6EYC1_9BACL|nr:HAMP domain-containing sensor histidine kinase [Paenibacillus protaetiae]QAY67253.1 HAMP domain-containing histidine kinase [Paenibacillus protaetiae]
MKNAKRAHTSGIKFRHSLLSRYVLIVLIAVIFLPIIFPLTAIAYLFTQGSFQQSGDGLKYGTASHVEEVWHNEAARLDAGRPDEVDKRLRELAGTYPEASVFWVDGGGTLHPVQQTPELPAHWTADDAMRFMKDYVGGQPFTVAAFLGEGSTGPGFMVIQLPRSLFRNAFNMQPGTPIYILVMFVLFGGFIFISLLFFRQIRQRLLRLQAAMALRGEDGLPLPIGRKKPDEIGQLEDAFNQMVEQLKASVHREREEQELRQQLISSLSHDLRTPLTVMNGHLYALQRERMSESGHAAMIQLAAKIDDLSSLIDNLLSYTLMTSGRYPLKLEELDVLRLVRETAASWYPLWEKEGIAADIDAGVTERRLLWRIDRNGFRRVLDNLFQNVVRHASGGRYIGLSLQRQGDTDALVISDRGSGMSGSGKGAGIGLAIVDHLIREMELEWEMDRSPDGTNVIIRPKQPGSRMRDLQF